MNNDQDKIKYFQGKKAEIKRFEPGTKVDNGGSCKIERLHPIELKTYNDDVFVDNNQFIQAIKDGKNPYIPTVNLRVTLGYMLWLGFDKPLTLTRSYTSGWSWLRIDEKEGKLVDELIDSLDK